MGRRSCLGKLIRVEWWMCSLGVWRGGRGRSLDLLVLLVVGSRIELR